MTDLEAGALVHGGRFPDAGWGGFQLAQLVLAEFGETGWQGISLGTLKPPTDPDDIFSEIEQIAGEDMRARLQRGAEILDQSASFGHYFAQVLMLSAAVNPSALAVIEMADRVGLMVAMHFKRKFARPRPQQVFRSLVPMIPGPPHASWPSGHSLESHLIALALSEIVPSAKPTLEALADRIGKNREIAGVHYRSDTAAGKAIARLVFPYLQQCATFSAAVDAAKVEWAATS